MSKTMTDDQINIAIAQACGWTEIANDPDWGWLGRPPNWIGKLWPVLDYCKDLNAMHDAEKIFFIGFEDEPESSEFWSDYQTNLIIACPAYLSYHATARQRAEAFLRTIGKWEEVAK